MPKLKINPERLWQNLMRMATIGKTAKDGVCRLAASKEDKAARDHFINTCHNLGLDINIDKIGNIFATRSGANPSAPAVLMHSHLDSQIHGGKFDGAVGVLAALEVIQTLNEANITCDKNIEIAVWTGEEGSRFAPAMLGSGCFAGVFKPEDILNAKDKNGLLLADELRKIKYQGDFPLGQRKYAAAFELHIEQGPILEQRNKQIGIVKGVQAISWYDIIIQGKEAHAGPTPMGLRQDPFPTLAAILPQIYAIAETYAPQARITCGDIKSEPGSRNTIASKLTVTLDIRHEHNHIIKKMESDIKHIIARHKDSEIRHIWTSKAIRFDDNIVNTIKTALKEFPVIPSMEMISGAGHDSVYISRIAPCAMIFIPCRNGISHNEEEFAKPQDIEAGANILLHSVLQHV